MLNRQQELQSAMDRLNLHIEDTNDSDYDSISDSGLISKQRNRISHFKILNNTF